VSRIAYKLTDAGGYTRLGREGETLWQVGSIVAPTGTGTEPCGPGVLHAYISPEVARFAQPIHGEAAKYTRCFEVEIAGDGEWRTDGLKRWTTSSLRVLREIRELPELTLEERVAWAICIAPHPSTRNWAIGWLSGRDRSAEAAWEAAWEAEEASAREAARASWSAAWAGEAAARASWAARAGADSEQRLMPMLHRARAILAGDYPAEEYDR